MPDSRSTVQWEVAERRGFTQHRRDAATSRGAARAAATRPRRGRGAASRAASTSTASAPGGEISPVGRTKTAPAPARARRAGASRSPPASSTSTATSRPTGTWREEDLDLVVHLGDYIYEYDSTDRRPAATCARHTRRTRSTTLADYRNRHAQYKTDPDLQAAHAAFAVDRHLGRPRGRQQLRRRPIPRTATPPRRSCAPARGRLPGLLGAHAAAPRCSSPTGPGPAALRRLRFGDLRRVQRARHAPVPHRPGLRRRQPRCASGSTPARTILGAEQEQWLSTACGSRGVERARPAGADGPARLRSGCGVTIPNDAWDGYAANRIRVVDAIAERKVSNPVVLCGDVHRHQASHVKGDYRIANAPIVATEFRARRSPAPVTARSTRPTPTPCTPPTRTCG